MNVLEEAYRVTNIDRKDQYGRCEDSFAEIGGLWSSYLGKKITSKDVALMMSLMKVAREKFKHKRDNLVDACGYLRLASKISGDEVNEVEDLPVLSLQQALGGDEEDFRDEEALAVSRIDTLNKLDNIIKYRAEAAVAGCHGC